MLCSNVNTGCLASGLGDDFAVSSCCKRRGFSDVLLMVLRDVTNLTKNKPKPCLLNGYWNNKQHSFVDFYLFPGSIMLALLVSINLATKAGNNAFKELCYQKLCAFCFDF